MGNDGLCVVYSMTFPKQGIIKYETVIVTLHSESFYNVLYTLPLFVRWHRLLERGIHTFLCLSAQALGYTYFRLSAQAFRTRHTHFPLCVVSAGSELYTLSLGGTGSYRTKHTHFLLIIGAGSGL